MGTIEQKTNELLSIYIATNGYKRSTPAEEGMPSVSLNVNVLWGQGTGILGNGPLPAVGVLGIVAPSTGYTLVLMVVMIMKLRMKKKMKDRLRGRR